MLNNKLSGLLLFFVIQCLNLQTASGQSVLENEKFRIEIKKNGALTFLDKMGNETWGNSLPGWVELNQNDIEEEISLTSSKVTLQKNGNTIKVEFIGIIGNQIKDEDFRMSIEVALLEQFFEVSITNLETKHELGKVEYPAHLFRINSGIEDGYVVVPDLQGILIPSRYDAGFMRFGQNIWLTIADVEKTWSFESGTINMPWFGAHRNTSNVFAYMETSSDAYLRVIGNSVIDKDTERVVNARRGYDNGVRISSLTPQWISSKGELSYTRRMRVELVENGYVGMAKRYREIAKETGRWVSMKEKIEKNPEYEKILGAVDLKVYVYTNRKNDPVLRAWSEPVLNGYSRVHTKFEEVGKIADDLDSMGVDKAMVLLGGWNRMGYDREHVDMWPPSAAAGGVKGLREACESVKSKGYLFALHDNYNDFYPDAPTFDKKYILQEKDGSLLEGGVWDGGLSYLICTGAIEPILNRNLDSIQNNIPLNAYYFDVITNTWHDQCYGKGHEMTRKDDLENRLDLLQNIVDRDLVIGGERGTDWSMPVAAFYEGMQGGGTGYHYGVAYRTGLSIPLFYLVYHDCVVGYWQHGTPSGREDHANHMLLDLLYAQPTSWSIVYDQWDDLKPLIKQASELQGKLHAQTAHQPMVDHQVLTDDFMVQKSIFGDGTEVMVNFGITTYKQNGITLPPKGFRIMQKGNVKTGAYERGLIKN